MVGEECFWFGASEVTALPHADDVDPEFFAQVGFLEGEADEGRSVDGSLGDEHFIEGAYYMGAGVGAGDAAGEEVAHLLGVADDMVGPCQFENVFGGGPRTVGGHGYVGGGVPGPEGDVHVADVIVGGDDHGGVVYGGFLEGFDFIQIA